MSGLLGFVEVMVNNPIYLVFGFLMLFLLLVIAVLAVFLIKQNKVLGRLEEQMQGFGLGFRFREGVRRNRVLQLVQLEKEHLRS